MRDNEPMETAIEANDLRMAKYRMAHNDGLKRQENWNDTYHGERMFGKSVVFGLVALILTWFSDLPGHVFYSIAALIVVLVLAVFWTSRRQGERLDELREQQMRDHAAKKAAKEVSKSKVAAG